MPETNSEESTKNRDKSADNPASVPANSPSAAGSVDASASKPTIRARIASKLRTWADSLNPPKAPTPTDEDGKSDSDSSPKPKEPRSLERALDGYERSWFEKKQQEWILYWIFSCKLEESRDYEERAHKISMRLVYLGVMTILFSGSIATFGWCKVMDMVPEKDKGAAYFQPDLPPHLWQAIIATTSTVLVLLYGANIVMKFAGEAQLRASEHARDMNETRRIETAILLSREAVKISKTDPKGCEIMTSVAKALIADKTKDKTENPAPSSDNEESNASGKKIGQEPEKPATAALDAGNKATAMAANLGKMAGALDESAC